MNKKQSAKKVKNFKTFPVPFSLEEIKENIILETSLKLSKEQIINKAFNFHSKGNLQEAEEYYQYFINKGFKDHRVFSNYGSILQNLGKSKRAEKLYRKAIEIKPDYAMAHSNLGGILRESDNLHEAELFTRKAIGLNPNFTEAHSNLGNILRDLGRLKEAELSTRKAIEINPDYAEAYSNLGNILRDLGRLKEAELSTRKAIELKSNLEIAHYNLGNILKDFDKLKEAEFSYRNAIVLKPDYAEAHSNLGIILNELGRLKEAELSYRNAIVLKPDYAEALFNLSYLELLKGDYKFGLENYEFRFKKEKPSSIHGNPKIEKVTYKEFKKGKKLLVISEQGLGDTLQYMRYIPYLKNLGLDVSFSAQPKLHSLIIASDIDRHPLTPKQANLVSEGKWIPLLSLPKYLQIEPKNPIISEPYINSTEVLNKKWKNILSKEKRPIVGINWQGNPEMEKIYQGRSIPLEAFSILADNNEITMLSLQKGFGSEQLKDCSFKNKFVESQPKINSTWDFLENAAIIQNCELIITCDTSIAHLAGGMGKKVWLLLKDIPFWTWGLEKDNTFWYPSMKLFRQKDRHNWQEVLERVSSTIKKEIEVKV